MFVGSIHLQRYSFKIKYRTNIKDLLGHELKQFSSSTSWHRVFWL